MSGTHSRRKPLKHVLIAVLSTLGLAAGAAAITLPANASPPPPPSGWTEVFTDDFNGAMRSASTATTGSTPPAPATQAAPPTGAPARSRR